LHITVLGLGLGLLALTVMVLVITRVDYLGSYS